MRRRRPSLLPDCPNHLSPPALATYGLTQQRAPLRPTHRTKRAAPKVARNCLMFLMAKDGSFLANEN